jgi:hypothetical protein
MKRTLLVFSLILGVAAAKAQNYEVVDDGPHIDVNRLRFGAYFAPNVSWMKPTSGKTDNGVYRVRSNGSRVGYTWGLMMDYFFAENYGISTGFQINNTGGSIRTNRLETDSVANTVYNSDFKYSLQYLEIPFQLKLLSDPIASANDLSVFGQIGLTAGFNIGKKATYEVGYTDMYGGYQTIEGDKEKLSGSFTIAPFMLQLNIGGGIQKPISEKMDFYFGLFFNNAFLPDVTNPNEYDLDYNGKFSDGNIRLNSFAFRLGLFF